MMRIGYNCKNTHFLPEGAIHGHLLPIGRDVPDAPNVNHIYHPSVRIGGRVRCRFVVSHARHSPLAPRMSMCEQQA